MRKALLALTLASIALAPSTAVAASTFGDNLQTAPTSAFNCDDTTTCTTFLSQLGTTYSAVGGFSAPSDGVVVKFTIRVGTGTSPVTFRLVRPTDSSNDYTGAGTGPSATPPANSTTPYSTRLPVKQGDRIGIDCCQGGSDSFFYGVPANQGSFSYWNTLTPPANLVDGAPGRSPEGTNASYALAVQATEEPDADHDGYGDETQDQCPTDASTHGPCPATPAPPGTGATTGNQKCKKAKKRKSDAGIAKKCKKHRKH